METWLWIIIAALLSGLIAGDSISPDKQEVSGKEGESVTLRCSYTTSYSGGHLYWYKHRSNQAPQFILYKGAGSSSGEYIPYSRYQSTTSGTSTELTITQLTLADTALYYCALFLRSTFMVWGTVRENNLLFGRAINLKVDFKDDTPHVAPTLSILHPAVGTGGPQVCLATGFYPNVSNNVILKPLNLDRKLLTSAKSRSYTFAAFAQGETIDVCKLKDVENNTIPTNAYLTTMPTPVAVNTTSEAFDEYPTDKRRLGSYCVLINGLRLILTKTLALNVLVVLRGLLV